MLHFEWQILQVTLTLSSFSDISSGIIYLIMKIEIPRLKFTKWMALKGDFKMSDFLEAREIGIYIVSRKKIKSIGNRNASYLDENLVYIGMTTNSLRYRLNNLKKQIYHTERGHSGGRKIRDTILPNMKPTEELFFAYAVVSTRSKTDKSLADFKSMGIVKFQEEFLLGKFYSKYGTTPKCNGYRRGEERFE